MTITSAYTFMVDFINTKEIGEEVSRYQMQAAFRKVFQQSRNINAIDSYKSYFVKLGFLDATKQKGFFKIAKHVPKDFTASDMRHMYNEATGFSEKKIEDFSRDITRAEYLQLKYKPIEFAIINDLTFIQGTILNLVVTYAEKKEKEQLDTIIFYASVSKFLNHNKRSVHYLSAIITRFCEINDLDLDLTTIVVKALQCRWNDIIELCETLLNNLQK